MTTDVVNECEVWTAAGGAASESSIAGSGSRSGDLSHAATGSRSSVGESALETRVVSLSGHECGATSSISDVSEHNVWMAQGAVLAALGDSGCVDVENQKCVCPRIRFYYDCQQSANGEI